MRERKSVCVGGRERERERERGGMGAWGEGRRDVEGIAANA